MCYINNRMCSLHWVITWNQLLFAGYKWTLRRKMQWGVNWVHSVEVQGCTCENWQLVKTLFGCGTSQRQETKLCYFIYLFLDKESIKERKTRNGWGFRRGEMGDGWRNRTFAPPPTCVASDSRVIYDGGVWLEQAWSTDLLICERSVETVYTASLSLSLSLS